MIMWHVNVHPFCQLFSKIKKTYIINWNHETYSILKHFIKKNRREVHTTVQKQYTSAINHSNDNKPLFWRDTLDLEDAWVIQVSHIKQ